MAAFTLALLLTATGLDGLLAGASLDQSIKQLPARRQMGVVAFSAYSRAADPGERHRLVRRSWRGRGAAHDRGCCDSLVC